MSDQKTDNLYANPLGKVRSFQFDESVVSVFPDMINRSVPGYSSIVATIGMLAKHYAQADTFCVDLGCSLGASTFAMADSIEDQSVGFIGVDNSQDMISHCKQLLSKHPAAGRVELRQEDILETRIDNASVVVLNFTLQFISPDERNQLISKIYQGLRSDGALILSEKVVFEDDNLQSLFTDLHHDFKRANGYSDLEISQKRAAIEDVLVPEPLSTHHERLAKAGFASSAVWFQCFNFASLVAVK
ncbi:MAG: carboxy-S-adenosyl-L-methionine synthase CmoA [Cellvibrionaceae bacterium]